MKPQEIRIGNLVQYMDREYKIYSMSPECPFLDTLEYGVGVIEWHDIKPIPLTEEWLLKMGFEKAKPEDGFGGFLSQWSNNWKMRIRYDTDTQKWFWLIDDYGTRVWLETVHRLQNLFYALCGEELTIKD